MNDIQTYLEELDKLSPEEIFYEHLNKTWSHFKNGTADTKLEGGIKYFHAAEMMQKKGEWGKIYKETARDSFEWLTKSSSIANIYLAKCYINGMGTEQNIDRARDLLETVIRTGEREEKAEACYLIGINYALFFQPQYAVQHAKEFLEEAAKLGNIKAKEELEALDNI